MTQTIRIVPARPASESSAVRSKNLGGRASHPLTHHELGVELDPRVRNDLAGAELQGKSRRSSPHLDQRLTDRRQVCLGGEPTLSAEFDLVGPVVEVRARRTFLTRVSVASLPSAIPPPGKNAMNLT